MKRLALLVVLLVPGSADAAIHHFDLRAGPFRIGHFNTRMLALGVPTPRVKGYVTKLHAQLVDRRGRRVRIDEAMLHHMYLRNDSRARVRNCNRLPEVFYGTGEENQTLDLPPGYGYRLGRRDRWELHGMLMSHRYRPGHVYVEYSGTVDTGRLRGVRPFWVKASGCRSSSYNVPGSGRPGAVHDKVFHWRVPMTGRIVAAGGHLHAGAIGLQLRDPRCGDRVLFDNRPFYAPANDLLYHAQPRLHEAGPVQTSWFSSRAGIPVRRGQTLDLHGLYENDQARGAVMAISHVYIAPGGPAPRRCPPLPADALQTAMLPGLRPSAPYQHVPLYELGAHHRALELTRPEGPVAHTRQVDLAAYRFQPAHVVVPAGARLTWRFRDAAAHNLTFASGPRAVGGQTYHGGHRVTARFTVPGRYQLFCYLHPMTMHEQIDVV
jgi:plastocyanin